MAVVRYTARRSLKPYVTAGEIVVLGLKLFHEGGLVVSRSPISHTTTSLSRRRETYYYGGVINYACVTIPMYADDQADIEQFLASVEDGQEFEFAANNSVFDGSISYADAYLASPNFGGSPVPGARSMKQYRFAIEVDA